MLITDSTNGANSQVITTGKVVLSAIDLGVKILNELLGKQIGNGMPETDKYSLMATAIQSEGKI